MSKIKSEQDKYLLTAALAPPLKAHSAWKKWRNSVDPKDAPHVLSWAGGYIYLNLKNIGEEDQYLRGIYRHNFLANNYRISQVRSTISVLTKQWTISPLKSFGMTVIDNSLGLRPIADFDFYVENSNASEVFEFLESHGYLANLSTNLFQFNSRLLKRRGSWNFINSEGFDLDLHWRLFDHLSFKENLDLTTLNSEIIETKHGRFRMLTPELMSVLLTNHHLLNASTHYSGLFDIARIVNQSNLRTISSLASRVGILTELREILEEIDDIAETSNANKLNLYSSSQKSNSKGILIDRVTDFDLIQNRYLYKIWKFSGKPIWMEKFITKYLGGFTKTDTLELDLFWDVILGSGWHYQYPGDKHRWMNVGDSRFKCFHQAKGTYELNLNWNMNLFNLIAHVDRLKVYLNGECIGTIEKGDQSVKIQYKVCRKGDVEFSIRSEGYSYYESTEFNFNWRLLSLPLNCIEIKVISFS